jgi:hypothetical protein
LLGAATNLQGRISNGVAEADACDTAALSASGRFYHLEQVPDVREEPQHILTALSEALDIGDDVPSPCDTVAALGCRDTAAKGSKINIADKTGNVRDRVVWKWSKGAATDVADFADAVAGASVYQVCIYDASASEQPLLDAGAVGAGTCGSSPCWRALGTKGYVYRDKLAGSDGISSIKLKSGVDGKAKVQFKAGGVNLDLAGLPLTAPVVVQLLIDDGNTVECWQSNFTSTPLVNAAEKFKAKQ